MLMPQSSSIILAAIFHSKPNHLVQLLGTELYTGSLSPYAFLTPTVLMRTTSV